jgi:Flp pilus assembly protein TadD
LLQRGLIALQHGQFVEARETLEQASRLEPKNPFVWASLAETYLRLNEDKESAAAAGNAEKLGAGNPLVARALGMYYSELGRTFIAEGQTANGEKYLELAWEKSKTDPQIAFDFSRVLLQHEDFTRAADVANSALRNHPESAQLTLALGVARYGQRRFEDAIAAFLRVIAIDSTIEQPYAFLGRMLEQAGTQLPQITAAYERWQSKDPKNPEAPLLLAKALLAADPGSARAEALLRRSIALDPKNWESHYELGVLLEGKRDYPTAAAELTRSIDLDARQAMTHYHLARVYDRLGQPERAKAEREIHRQLTGSHAPGGGD